MRAVALLVALYLALDFSTPLIPGAFTFNPDESVEVVADSGYGAAVAVLAAMPDVTPSWHEHSGTDMPILRLAARPLFTPIVVTRLLALRADPEPSPSPDDH